MPALLIVLIFAKGNKDVSKRWEIIIPLSSVLIEQWNVKGESRRKQLLLEVYHQTTLLLEAEPYMRQDSDTDLWFHT